MQLIQTTSFNPGQEKSMPQMIAERNGLSSSGDKQVVSLIEQLKAEVQQLKAKQEQPQQVKADNVVEVKPDVAQTTDDSIEAASQEKSEGISLDNITQTSPFIPSWRVYWGQKEYTDEEKEELQKKQEEAAAAVEKATKEQQESEETAEKELAAAKEAADKAYAEAKQAAQDEYNQTVEQAATERDNTIQGLDNTRVQAQQAETEALQAYSQAMAGSGGEDTPEVIAARQAYEAAALAAVVAQREYEEGKQQAESDYNSAEEAAKEVADKAESAAEEEREDTYTDAELEAEKTKSDAQEKLEVAQENAAELNNSKAWGLKVWNPKILINGVETKVKNKDDLLDESKIGIWYAGLFDEEVKKDDSASSSSDSSSSSSSETTEETHVVSVVRIVHETDEEGLKGAKWLIPICEIEDGGHLIQYHVGVLIVGSSHPACWDITSDGKYFTTPWFRVEQGLYVYEGSDEDAEEKAELSKTGMVPIKMQEGYHTIVIDHSTGHVEYQVLTGLAWSDTTYDVNKSFIPLYYITIQDKEISKIIDLRNVPTALAIFGSGL